MGNITLKLEIKTAQKIFGNVKFAEDYLLRLKQKKQINNLKYKTISRGKNKGLTSLNMSSNELWKCVVDSWDYEESKTIIREMFTQSPKYQIGTNATQVIRILNDEWVNLGFGKLLWPFSQGGFDEYVQQVNTQEKERCDKDEDVKKAAVKYRRIKEINTVRNDFIETLIFQQNENIIPTLKHNRGVDFFINGVSFDQKVAKSPTKEFKNAFGDDWRQHAIDNPNTVAEYLYKYQDEGRFGADSRLLIVYIDENVSTERIISIISNVDLTTPAKIKFKYKHKSIGIKEYEVDCFIILLHN